MKRLYRSKKNKIAAGVCGGIGEYFDVDPVLVRILFVLSFFMGGLSVFAYIVGWIIIPFRRVGEVEPEPVSGSPKRSLTGEGKGGEKNGTLIFGIIMVAIGAFFLMKNVPFLSGIHWWFRWHFHEFIIPGVLIVLGTFMVIKSREKNGDGDSENSEMSPR